jgi:hypothetical protein
MNLGELTDRVLRRLAENTDAPAAVTAAEVAASLNRAQRLFALLTLSIERTAPFSLSVDTVWYRAEDQLGDFLLPLRCAQRAASAATSLWGVPEGDTTLFDEAAADRGPAARVRPATLYEMDALDVQWQTRRGDTMRRYGVLGYDLMFCYPAPQTEGLDCDLTYAAMPRPMASDSDEPDIPREWQQFLSSFAIPDLRLKDGGAELERAKPLLNEFLDAAQRCADKVRHRYRTLGYDAEPFELKSYDRSRLLAEMRKGKKSA